jgi:hypothetical protein
MSYLGLGVRACLVEDGEGELLLMFHHKLHHLIEQGSFRPLSHHLQLTLLRQYHLQINKNFIMVS